MVRNMGADRVTVFYRIRFQVVQETEISQLRLGRHPLIKAAKKYKPQHYWGNFSLDGGDYYLLYIGTELGEFGGEGKADLELSDDAFAKIQRYTKKKMAAAGFSLRPALMVQFEPDV